ncbi:hypothetical protein B9Z55_004940 [Caenorhabditis nigoni]|uniref:Zer-1-like leucine-rich repeats region domain-containing protein n=1 Tax=Caenorhabditis nigoni TaxID=1611254 RepID=A0A2G5UZE0_9PELO|nr:hypothetical protein B9Z55_004940 [Caenorhabditis nigoni]
MLFPTLFQFAVRSVAQQIHNEKISFEFNLDAKSSNTVVRELLKLDPKNIEKLKKYKNQLSTLTELDLNECKIDVEGILNLKNFKLNSLEFGDLNHLKREFSDPAEYDGIDIVNLLENALNTTTQKMMVHLGFSGKGKIIDDWEEKISKLLPSLQSIKINNSTSMNRYQFSNLCNSFPNLRVLDISHTKNLATLKGIKNLKHLQKLVMHDVGIYWNIQYTMRYEELSELKNLRVLDVSAYDSQKPIRNIPVIRALLQAEVRMENLELLDCSRAFVEDHELREFVEHHPKLKTVVAISAGFNDLSIPTIELLNFFSTDSTLKSLEYALTNNNDDLVFNCINAIMKNLDTSHESLHDSDINRFLNALFYVSKATKNEAIKDMAIFCLANSSFFTTERFFTSFSLEIPGIVEFLFKSWDSLERESKWIPSILTLFKRIVDFLRFGRILQDRLMYFIMEKTVELSCQDPENMERVASILIAANRFMSLEQYTAMCNNTKVINGLFEISFELISKEPSLYQQIMEIIVSYLNEASEDTLKYLVSNYQAVEKCYKQVIWISRRPIRDEGGQKYLSHIVFRLITFINLNDPFEKTKALVSCSIISLLLAKNLIDNRDYANTKIKEFNDSWDQSNLPDCVLTRKRRFELNTILTSEYSTDESICFALILISTFIDTEGYESREDWNWMRKMSEDIRNNEKWSRNTRESAERVLHTMDTIENEWDTY